MLSKHTPNVRGLMHASQPRSQSCPYLPFRKNPSIIVDAFSLVYVKPADHNEVQTIVEGLLGFWLARTHRRLPRGDVADLQTP